MREFIDNFISYLVNEKDSSPLTIHKYRSDLNRLMDYLNSTHKISNINDVTTNIIRDYLSYLKQSYPYKSSAMANKINIIKHFFSFLSKSGYIGLNPTSLLSTPKKIKKLPKVLNEIELAKLLSAPNYIKSSREKKNTVRDKLILTMFAYTGIRRSELLNLSWDDINLGEKYLIVRKAKNKTDRLIPLHTRVSQLLDVYLAQRLPLKDNALFIGEQGKRLRKITLVNLYKKYLKISGLMGKGYTIHTLRHTFATLLLKKDVNIVAISNLLGHKSLDSTQIYLHLTANDLKNSLNVL